MCIDYRKLNNLTIKDRFPLPRIDDQLDKLHGSKFFTTLDLTSGYYQIPVSENSKHLTSFVTPDGQYEFNKMPFGLCNAPSVFQRLMNHILLPYHDLAAVYLDDILIYSKSPEQNIEKFETLLQILEKGGLTLNPQKCSFLCTTVTSPRIRNFPKRSSAGTRKMSCYQELSNPKRCPPN